MSLYCFLIDINLKTIQLNCNVSLYDQFSKEYSWHIYNYLINDTNLSDDRPIYHYVSNESAYNVGNSAIESR
jgi:hypothetical protein